MMHCISGSNEFARQLFDGIAANYQGPARVFSLWQYNRWQRFLISRLEPLSGKRVLDMSTGTGLVAMAIARQWDAQVVGVDLSSNMLATGLKRLNQSNLRGTTSLVLGRAEDAPFVEKTFDAVVFTYLLRYVENVPSTLVELSRVLKPGGVMASLEFGVPSSLWLRLPWLAYTHLLMPGSMYILSAEWRRVGRFLGPSIRRFYHRYPLSRLIELWNAAGLQQVESKTLSLGGASVIWGIKGQ